MASPSASGVGAGSDSGPSEVVPTATNSASQNSSPTDQPSADSTLPTTQPPPNPTTASAVSAPPVSATVPTSQTAAPSTSAVTIAATTSPNPTSTPAVSSTPAAASLLPRSTMTASSNVASSSASSSSSNSGTATPTTRPQASTPYYTTARASSSLGLNSSIASGRGRRVSQHNPTSRTRFTSAASAMASTDNTNILPSIFGYYSHDAIPTTTQANPNTISTSPNAGPGWRTRASNPQPAAARSNGPVRIDRSFLASPNASPRVGSLSFYQHGTRQPWDSPSTLGTAYPSRTLPDHTAAASTSAYPASINSSNSNDAGLFASALPAPQPTFEETTTISFTWTIRDLHLLREEVEQTPPPSEGGRSVSAGAGKSDVWTNQPVFGDNKWKLELVRTTRPLTDQEQDTSASHSIGDEIVAPSDPGGSVEAGDTETSRQRNSITILSVYLTALVLDYTHANVEIPASIMIGLRPLRAAVGRRGAEDGGYLWRQFYDYVFQKEADLFTCHDLPSVSEMLQDISVARDDAIVLTIQLGLGPGHTRRHAGSLEDNAVARAPVEVDGHQLVPRAVINSLSGLLDDANTGDVRILVRERGILLPSETAAMSDDDNDVGHPAPRTADSCLQVVPYPIGASCPPSSAEAADADALDSIEDDPNRIFVRDRVLWAHASVLRSRSDYFHTMLGSDFSEGIGRSLGAEVGSASRNVRTLRIPDADFVTAYWFLRYLYTDDIQFADQEDVRSAVLDEEWAKGADLGCISSSPDAGIGAGDGASSRMLVDWTPVSQLKDCDDFDMDAGAAADPAEMAYSMSRGHPSSSSIERRDVSGSFVLQASPLRNAAPASSATTSGSLRPRTSGAGLGGGSSSGVSTATGSSVGPVGGNTASAPTSPSIPAASSISSGAGKQHHTTDEAYHVGGTHRNASGSSAVGRDPHPHPCSHPGPASALAIFRLAHRYHMQELSRLASVHLVATLTPQTAFAMLLATAVYAELHARIKTYVHQHWHLVSRTPEFERCCDEVSVGMWGADAGKTLRAFVRSLVSPLHAGATTNARG